MDMSGLISCLLYVIRTRKICLVMIVLLVNYTTCLCLLFVFVRALPFAALFLVS